MMKLLDRFELNLALVVLLTVFAFAPLTYPGFFQTHSGFLPLYNLYDLENHLGQVNWAPTVGRTYDLFRGEGPLPYYLAEIFRWLGASAAAAVKWGYGLCFVLAALAMYGWIKGWLGPRAALIAAVVYTYIPYHLVVVYVRGSLAEALFWALLPLTFWAVRVAIHKGFSSPLDLRYIITGLLPLLALGYTNLGLTTLCILLLIGYTWVESRSLRVLARISLFLGPAFIALVALMVAERPEPGVDFYQHFVYLFQLFSVTWDYGQSVPGWGDTMSFQLGLAPLGLALLSILLIVPLITRSRLVSPCSDNDSEVVATSVASPVSTTTKVVTTGSGRVLLFFLGLTLVMVLLLLSPTTFFWRITGLSRLMTYPWQVLIFASLSLAVLAGSVAALNERLASFPLQAGLITLIVLGSYSYLSPRTFYFEIDFTPEAKQPHFHNVEPQGPLTAILGDNQVALLEHRLEGPLRHGATVRLNVLWQTLRPMDEDYVVFVHAVDDQGTIWGQRDVEPKQGEHPTSEWEQGEVVWDRYELRLDVDGPREGYRLEVGLYQPDTGQRLKVGENDDKVIIYEQ